MKQKKPLTVEEHIRNLETEFMIYEELSKLREGKQVRDYMKAHKDEIKRCGVDVPFYRRYPYFNLVVAIIAFAISIITLFLK